MNVENKINIKKEWFDNIRRKIKNPLINGNDQKWIDLADKTLDELENGSIKFENLVSYVQENEWSLVNFFSLKFSVYEFIVREIILTNFAEKVKEN